MQKDVDEMQAMLEGYLAFARGDAGELTELTDLRAHARGPARRRRAPWRAASSVDAKGDLNVKVRPLAIKRCIGNLIANALRYGQNESRSTAAREQRFVIIHVDDDGPGIAPEHRDDVFRRFSGSTKRAIRTKAAPALAWRSRATSPAPTAARSRCRPARLAACAPACDCRSRRARRGRLESRSPGQIDAAIQRARTTGFTSPSPSGFVPTSFWDR